MLEGNRQGLTMPPDRKSAATIDWMPAHRMVAGRHPEVSRLTVGMHHPRGRRGVRNRAGHICFCRKPRERRVTVPTSQLFRAPISKEAPAIGPTSFPYVRHAWPKPTIVLRRRSALPAKPNPTSISAHDAGSGTEGDPMSVNESAPMMRLGSA